MKSVILCVCFMLACVSGQRITTIQLDGVQYFISRMNPYSPELNYFLAYQYCRSLGLQLASFETREKVESMTQYLTNAGYSKYDFWTSGNRLGTGMFLWMSTGLPFNATFDYFESTQDVAAAGLDPHDHNSNTSPQRTARDSSSGLEKGCVMLKAPTLKWAPEDCSAVKDFICEQTRCYYYNYGSIPVSSSQGRPITPSTPPQHAGTSTTTPMPYFVSSTLSTFAMHEMESSSPFQPQFTMTEPQQIPTTQEQHELEPLVVQHDEEHDTEEEEDQHHDVEHDPEHDSEHDSDSESEYEDSEPDTNELARSHNTEETEEEEQDEVAHEEEIPVEQKLKQISKEIEAKSNSDKEHDRPQSFFSLSDLIKTLRPNDKVVPQIDSDYSNTMRVLTQNSGNIEKQQINRSLY